MLLLCSLLIFPSTLAFADSFSAPSVSGFHWEGSNYCTNPWSGNPYATIYNHYYGSDALSNTTLAQENKTDGTIGHAVLFRGNGSQTLTGSSYFSATIVSFSSIHTIDINGTYYKHYLSSRP